MLSLILLNNTSLHSQKLKEDQSQTQVFLGVGLQINFSGLVQG